MHPRHHLPLTHTTCFQGWIKTSDAPGPGGSCIQDGRLQTSGWCHDDRSQVHFTHLCSVSTREPEEKKNMKKSKPEANSVCCVPAEQVGISTRLPVDVKGSVWCFPPSVWGHKDTAFTSTLSLIFLRAALLAFDFAQVKVFQRHLAFLGKIPKKAFGAAHNPSDYEVSINIINMIFNSSPSQV